MKTPIIMVAFGTTSKAIVTYQHIDEKIKNHFKEYEILWSYSSRIISQQLQLQGEKEIQHPTALFKKLTEQGYKNAIVQSLHLFPGTEFDNLVKIAQATELECISGPPLINSPDDYHKICQILQPLIAKEPGKATLILGHGTYHPTWTSYYCLETILRQHFGNQVYVGAVEKFPHSEHLIEEIIAAGYDGVRIIPFFLVAGMHVKRDIIGDNDLSWQGRFNKKGITTEIIEQGLGTLPGFENIIIRHIETSIGKPQVFSCQTGDILL